MKTLKELLFGVQIEAIIGDTQCMVAGIAFDSRKVTKGSLFLAISGGQTDGHKFIDQALANGAVAVICEQRPEKATEEVVWVTSTKVREALAVVANNFYDAPSSQLKLIGITGTNGKTSIATLLYHLFSKAGYPSGLISTIAVRYLNSEFPATHTTPDPLQLNAYLSTMVREGVSHVFMEVSSHGIAQDRIHGLQFSGGVFTNLSHDHLDYHQTFAAYRDVKKSFFDGLPKTSFALANADDKNGSYMLQNTKANPLFFGLKNHADFHARILETRFDGMLLQMDGQELWSPLIGQFNAENLLTVYAVALQLGLPIQEVLTHLSSLQNAEGRFQTYATKHNAIAIIDYAHTPDALKNVMKTITQLRTKNEKFITIVGCGGNRDAEKRPIMGQISAQMSDKVIFTSDNPREEDPEAIIDAMEKGVAAEHMHKTLRITDRRAAIRAACMELNPGDVLLVAGKGHEKYQEVKGVKMPFDDYQVKQEFCNQLF